MRTHFGLGLFVLLSALTACQSQDPEVPIIVDNQAPVVSEVPPPAISGGTMLVLSDGRVLIADADRDRVHIVSISPARFEADALFEEGAEPGRSVEGSEGLAHVVLRQAGDVATIDINSGEILERRHLCTDPRGIAFNDANAQLYVACADGTLVTMPEHSDAGEVQRRFLEPDLRDIVIDGDTLLVSRLRSAEILEVAMPGLFVTGRRAPPAAEAAVPTVAWRMLEVEPGRVAMLHQLSATTEVRLSTPPGGEEGGDDDGGGDSGAPYGGGSFCQPPIVTASVSTWVDSNSPTTTRMAGPTPAVDLAISPDGEIAIAVAGAREGEGDVHFNNDEDFCFEGFGALSTPGQPVSVAYLPDGRLLVQSREPSALYVYNSSREHELTLELSSKSRFDTGHDLYHRVTAASISCASCHPEATDDGHVWSFEDIGRRRTQSPEVGLEGSAPFHWDGDMTDFQTLSNVVYSHRMGGAVQSDARAAAFERWLFSTKRAPAGTDVDESLRAEGEALFVDYGCTTCHSGARLTNDQTVAFRGKPLQVPSLRRVALRPPYMHDGRTADLRSAVLDMLEATRSDSEYSGHDVDAIVAYLRTL
ncbi:c-type cytochrome [Enhygromyxa salina]|uniref:Cytochrome c n=1 Tax=Enhygromyxa salina TaxID=215803 RepID=A0A2S9YU19_9BACT|nr:c-type cytochrome [Enhygromyxa salina]PRQ08607.1 Cytochrome c [Enhygromyxa salina]